MTTYYVTVRTYATLTIEAESESAARQAVIDDSYDDIEYGDFTVIDIEEAQ